MPPKQRMPLKQSPKRDLSSQCRLNDTKVKELSLELDDIKKRNNEMPEAAFRLCELFQQPQLFYEGVRNELVARSIVDLFWNVKQGNGTFFVAQTSFQFMQSYIVFYRRASLFGCFD